MRRALRTLFCLGGRDFLRMVFALVHVEADLLIGDADSRHELSASSLRVDQPSYCPPTRRRLRFVVNGGYAISDSSPPARTNFNDRPR
jgi:hypothetical protein